VFPRRVEAAWAGYYRKLVAAWGKREEFRFFYDKFGLGTPRMLFELPEFNKWRRAVHAAATELALSQEDMKRIGCGCIAFFAYVNVRPTKNGASFSWNGAWEYDQMSGTGSLKPGKDGKLHGRIKIKDSDSSTFIAERTSQPTEPIPDPPSYRDKWTRRW
jgi:hypothetical protein